MDFDVHGRCWWRDPGLSRRGRSVDWWENAVIYQIAPWSFQDTDGDGTGDLQGVIRRLDYITSLSVDAIWLTPIYDSPMDDLGYDVIDMCEIGSVFGTMENFDTLVELVHERGMKLVLDMVWNHTSDRHPWFQESRANRSNSKADWYVWADPGADGGPPNNWRSVFNGESGWRYVESRGQYNYFNFLESQPDLNWHNEEVRRAVLKRARFWLDRGIDGMRLDAVNFYCHDAQLRDNPVRRPGQRKPDGIDPGNPAAEHCFVNSFCREETLAFLKPLRELSNEYPGTMLLGEVTLCEDTIDLAAQYVRGHDRLHLAYHSGLHFDEALTAERLHALIDKVLQRFIDGGACWIVGNHDYGRLRSYWGGKDRPYGDDFYHMVAALLICLPGALCLWQGDELGLPEARIPEDIPQQQIRDPFGKLLYPTIKGRDGSRTPMPWQHDAPHAGFTAAEPWLPIPESHLERAVDLQNADPRSLLNTWRRLLHWRYRQPALKAGSCKLLPLDGDRLALIREHAEQRLLCLYNLSESEADVDLSGLGPLRPVQGLGYPHRSNGKRAHLKLPPWGVLFADIGESRT